MVLRNTEVFHRRCRPLLCCKPKGLNLHVLIVGSDVVAYGGSRSDGRSWGAWAKEEIALDPKRTHWLGALQTEEYHDVLAISDVHLYLTVPFVLSWSLLEAMAAGCAAWFVVPHHLWRKCSSTTVRPFWLTFFSPRPKQRPLLVCLTIQICGFPWLQMPRRSVWISVRRWPESLDATPVWIQ